MKDSRFYFLLGFMTAILVAIIIIINTEPLQAKTYELGSAEWCPLYVKVVE